MGVLRCADGTSKCTDSAKVCQHDLDNESSKILQTDEVITSLKQWQVRPYAPLGRAVDLHLPSLILAIPTYRPQDVGGRVENVAHTSNNDEQGARAVDRIKS